MRFSPLREGAARAERGSSSPSLRGKPFRAREFRAINELLASHTLWRGRVKVSSTEREQREAVLTVELDNDDVEPYLDQAYRQAVRRLAIPGFRKGKAPRRIVEQMYGRGYLLQQAFDTLIQDFTFKAVEEEGLDIGGAPSVDISEYDPPAFTATVPLEPRVDLGDYRAVRVPKDEPAVDEEEVDALLERLRVELAVWEPAEDEVRMEDLINLTIDGWVDEEPERRDVVHSEETDYIPRPDTNFPVPGLDEGLVGLPVGEKRAFDVEVPEDFANSDLAGKTVHFEATIHSIKRKDLADLDDEFAKGVEGGYESLEALREKIHADLLERATYNARVRHENEVLAKVVEAASIEIAPLIIDHEVEHHVHDLEETVKAGRGSFEDFQEYLSWQGKSQEEVQAEARPRAEERLKRAHVIRAVAAELEVETGDEEIDREVEDIAGRTGDSADEVRKLFEDPERRDSIRRVLMNRTTLERLSEIALQTDGAPAETAPEPEGEESGGDGGDQQQEQSGGS